MTSNLAEFLQSIGYSPDDTSMASVSNKTRPESPVVYSDDDAQMQAAYAKARETLIHFWKVFENSDRRITQPCLKVSLPTNDDAAEHIWIKPLRVRSGVYTGELVSDPHDLKGGLQAGDIVSFQLQEISDWAYWDGSKARGHFTTRQLLYEMTAKDARAMKATLHHNPLP